MNHLMTAEKLYSQYREATKNRIRVGRREQRINTLRSLIAEEKYRLRAIQFHIDRYEDELLELLKEENQ